MSDNQDSDSEVNFNLNNRPIGFGGDDNGRGDDNLPMRRAISNIKPDAFKGEEDWDQYISYFEDCAELCRWSEREKLLFLTTSLKQQARVHCSSLAAHEKNSYAALVYSLGQRFGSKRQQSRWISKLQNRTRGRNETIAAFGDEVRLYLQKAYVTLDQETQEMLALQQFYKNVSPEMRCRLMDRDCRTISEAVEIVERYEEVMGKADINAKTSHVRKVSRSGSVPESRLNTAIAAHQEPYKEMDGIKHGWEKIEERLTKLENKGKPKNTPSLRTCFTCGSSNHSYRECPNREGNGPRSGNQGNANPSRR